MGTDTAAPAGFSAGIRLLARLSRVAETAFHDAGISLPQYRLLAELAERPRRAGEMATELGVTRPSLTSLVDGLERNGLLRRVPVADDRRGIRLETTETGLRALAEAEATLVQRLEPLVDAKSAARAGEMVSAIARALGDSAHDGDEQGSDPVHLSLRSR